MTVVWQSALPPTLCTICQCILYVQFTIATQVCPHFHSLRRDLGFFRYAFTRADADHRFSPSEKIGTVVLGYSRNGWQALRPFPLLYNVRHHSHPVAIQQLTQEQATIIVSPASDPQASSQRLQCQSSRMIRFRWTLGLAVQLRAERPRICNIRERHGVVTKPRFQPLPFSIVPRSILIVQKTRICIACRLVNMPDSSPHSFLDAPFP